MRWSRCMSMFSRWSCPVAVSVLKSSSDLVFTMKSVNTYFVGCIVVYFVKCFPYIVNQFVVVCVVEVDLVNA